LSNETINKSLTRLGQILGKAKKYGLIANNPAREEGTKLKVSRPGRSYLDSAAQIEALLEAARTLDAEATRYPHLNRHGVVATLVFAGLRISELLALTWGDVDLANGWLTVRQAKTDAGVRRVKLRPVLRDVLAEHKPADADAQALVFGTTEGKRHSPSNIRRRVLSKSVAGAKRELPALTPHSLRRTFCSLLFALASLTRS
jgi:integrase